MRVEECSYVTWVQCLLKWRYKSNVGCGVTSRETAVFVNLSFLSCFTDCWSILWRRMRKTQFSMWVRNVLRFIHISCQSLQTNCSQDTLHRFEIDCTWKVTDRPQPRHLHGRRLNYDCRRQYTVDIWRQGGKLAPEFFACFCLREKIILDKNLFIFG